MRLCYITNPHGIHSRRWLEHFRDRGHEIYLITIFTDFPPIKGIKTYCVSPLPPKFTKKIGRGHGWLSLLFSSWRIRRLIQRIRPDVVHAHSAAFFGWLAAISGFHPMIITLWGNDILADQGALNFPKNWITPLALRRADLVTGFAQHLLTTADPYLNPNAERHAIRLGADLKNFNPTIDGRLWRTRLELGNHPVILSPRSIAPVYNIETIVAAMPFVLEEIPEACLVLIGHNANTEYESYQTQIRQMVTKLNVEHAVRFVGKVPYHEMASFYRLADVVVSVSLSDGFPATVMETMACGAPMVLSQIPHLTELITDKRNALTVPPKDPRQLAKAILRLLKDETLKQNMIATNLELVKTHGNFELEMQKMEKLYEGLI